LNLKGNQLGVSGTKVLAEFIESHPLKIEDLNLEGNKIGDIAGGIIIRALSSLRVLKKLTLNDNELSTNSGLALFE